VSRPEIKVRLFGRLSIRSRGQALETHLSGKAQELLTYLLLFRRQSHHRERLATLLWEESEPSQSRRNLRKALWQLQAAQGLGPSSDGGGILLLESEWIGIRPEAGLWIDAARLEETYLQLRELPGRALDAASAQLALDAVNLYQGSLLEGCFQDWCLLERARLQDMYLILLDKLMGFCEAHGDYETGLICGARALQHDRAREVTHRQLMRLYYKAGDRTGALRQFKRCLEALQEELGILPSERTMVLFELIQADRLSGSDMTEQWLAPLEEDQHQLHSMHSTKPDKTSLESIPQPPRPLTTLDWATGPD